MQHVTVVSVENCLVSSVVGVMDILTVANHLSGQPENKFNSKGFKIQLVSQSGNKIPSFNGVTLNPECSIHDVDDTDLIFIPAILPPVESIIPNCFKYDV